MIVFISAKNKKTLIAILIAYTCITIFILIFGIIYESFSHDVYSFWMQFAWIWVLAFGLVPHLLLLVLPIKRVPGLLTGCCLNLGVALFTAGSIYKGVVDIYGTTRNEMFSAYMIISAIMLGAAIGLYAFGLSYFDNSDKENNAETKL